MIDDAVTTPSRIPSVQHSPRLSSGVADSKRSTIREGDLPLSKLLKTSGFVASHQKVAKESGDLEQELHFTLCINITRSDQVLIITCLRIEHLSQALPFLYVSVSFYTSIFTWLTCLWPCALPCGLARTFHHLLNSSTFHVVLLLVGYSPSLLYTLGYTMHEIIFQYRITPHFTYISSNLWVISNYKNNQDHNGMTDITANQTFILGLERISDYPDKLSANWTSGSVSLYPGTRLMFVHAQKPNTWSRNCNKMAVDKSLAPYYQLFWLLESRTICTCINIYCSWLQQKGEVIQYILVQTSHTFFRAIIRVSDSYCELISR